MTVGTAADAHISAHQCASERRRCIGRLRLPGEIPPELSASVVRLPALRAHRLCKQGEHGETQRVVSQPPDVRYSVRRLLALRDGISGGVVCAALFTLM